MQDDLQGEDEILAPTQHYQMRNISYTTSDTYEDKFLGAGMAGVLNRVRKLARS